MDIACDSSSRSDYRQSRWTLLGLGEGCRACANRQENGMKVLGNKNVRCKDPK